MSKLAYICAPYSGDIDKNIKQANKYAEQVYQHGFIPVTPHNLFPFIKEEETIDTRKWALKADLCVLEKCDFICVFENKKLTEGMRIELEFAQKHDIPVWYFGQLNI